MFGKTNWIFYPLSLFEHNNFTIIWKGLKTKDYPSKERSYSLAKFLHLYVIGR